MFIREEKYGNVNIGPSQNAARMMGTGQRAKFVVHERTLWERIKDWWLAPAW